jgi:hypothetical protein
LFNNEGRYNKRGLREVLLFNINIAVLSNMEVRFSW